jgi:hypothetical protein
MEHDYEFAGIWREAFEEYKKRTGRDLLIVINKNPSLQSVEDLQGMIEQTNKDFGAFRHRHAIWSCLKSVMRPVQVLGSLAQSGLGLTPFAPGKFLTLHVSFSFFLFSGWQRFHHWGDLEMIKSKSPLWIDYGVVFEAFPGDSPTSKRLPVPTVWSRQRWIHSIIAAPRTSSHSQSALLLKCGFVILNRRRPSTRLC